MFIESRRNIVLSGQIETLPVCISADGEHTPVALVDKDLEPIGERCTTCGLTKEEGKPFYYKNAPPLKSV